MSFEQRPMFCINGIRNDFQKLLIFRIGHLGDTVVALPALWAIREALPSAQLTVLTNINSKNPHYISARNVLPERGLIDGYIEYPSEAGFASRSASTLKLAAELRRKRFDAVLYLMPRIRSDLQIARDRAFFAAAGISRVLGVEFLRHNRLGRGNQESRDLNSEADFLLELLRSEGFGRPPEPRTDLMITPAEVSEARRVFERLIGGRAHGKRLIGVAPGSKWPSKIWPEANYAEVVRRLTASDGCYPIILGGSEDAALGDRLIANCGDGANLAGELSVRGSAAILAQCELYLGNDTGTMHLAGAVGTPCVAIFAAIDWAGRWVPFGDRNTIFRRTVECEKCMTPNCFNNNECLKLVTVEDVYRACSTTLATAGADASRAKKA